MSVHTTELDRDFPPNHVLGKSVRSVGESNLEITCVLTTGVYRDKRTTKLQSNLFITDTKGTGISIVFIWRILDLDINILYFCTFLDLMNFYRE